MFLVLRFAAEICLICPAAEITASKLDVTLAGVVRSSANSTTSPSTAAGNATPPAPLLPGANWEMTGPRLEPTSWLSNIRHEEALKLPSPTSPRRRPCSQTSTLSGVTAGMVKLGQVREKNSCRNARRRAAHRCDAAAWQSDYRRARREQPRPGAARGYWSSRS